jgi:hypothetical protein
MYYFAPTRDLGPRIIPYRSIKETTKRTVFSAYQYKKGDRLGEVAYYRHSAFLGEFRRFDADWYLEITPTYLFTSDGRKRHPFYESKLKGIKALEKNGTVLPPPWLRSARHIPTSCRNRRHIVAAKRGEIGSGLRRPNCGRSASIPRHEPLRR